MLLLSSHNLIFVLVQGVTGMYSLWLDLWPTYASITLGLYPSGAGQAQFVLS